jgi:cellulose synthase/poly-beta-1,6-N-acetylglucosamine synthase-like glycosyltransferase
MDLLARYPNARFRLTSSARLNLFIADKGRAVVACAATSALRSRWPSLCAGSSSQPFRIGSAALFAALLAILVAFPIETLIAMEAGLATAFLIALSLRLLGSYLGQSATRTEYVSDRELPLYTIIVALYRESKAVEGLVASLRELDYPPEKLDIKFVIEADDLETWHALADLKLGAPFEIIIAPQEFPRTKPKALNAALLFARGTYTVVFDAEDRPERDQLRRALSRFQTHGHELACVQAALTIDNTGDSWLARLFTAEYAAQFDLFLPGLARLRLPLPLGGSSNHFRTAALREVGAWDPYNVTEDADLGMRLARFGYHATVIDSTTYEEAPARMGAWLRQRTRWMKGWMQTWAVHMRSPRRLLKELGAGGFLTFQLVVGGNVLAALIHPIFLASIAYAFLADCPILSADGPAGAALTWLFATSLIAGYLISVGLGMRGLARRGLLAHAWALALVWAHWVLLSVAAWRALYQLVRDPQGWEKTEHGLAKSSRRRPIKYAAAGDLAADEQRQPKLRSAA